jgi:hypothetical protein
VGLADEVDLAWEIEFRPDTIRGVDICLKRCRKRNAGAVTERQASVFCWATQGPGNLGLFFRKGDNLTDRTANDQESLAAMIAALGKLGVHLAQIDCTDRGKAHDPEDFFCAAFIVQKSQYSGRIET